MQFLCHNSLTFELSLLQHRDERYSRLLFCFKNMTSKYMYWSQKNVSRSGPSSVISIKIIFLAKFQDHLMVGRKQHPMIANYEGLAFEHSRGLAERESEIDRRCVFWTLTQTDDCDCRSPPTRWDTKLALNIHMAAMYLGCASPEEKFPAPLVWVHGRVS